MDPRLDGPLRDALIAFLQQEGLATQQPAAQPLGPQPRRRQTPASLTSYLDPSLARLPMVMPQAAQSGNPTSQNVGQTLGPQPGEPLNRTREQLYADTTRGVNAMAASALDPLGIPSAALGLISPHARDAWRETQGQVGLGPQLAGGLPAGFGAANAMLRGARALGGIPGMIAGGGATGAAPAIDYAGGAPGVDGADAVMGPLAGAALPAGIGAVGAMRPAINAMRANPGATAAGGATALAAGSAVAQQSQPELDQFTQTLHTNNPALAAAYQRMLAARQAATTANQTSIAANQGRQTNSGARQAAERADAAAQEATRAYQEALQIATDRMRAANPSFRDNYGPTLSNRFIRSMLPPFALGMIGGAGASALGRRINSMAHNEVAAGNAALETGNIAGATTASANATALTNPAGQNWFMRGLNRVVPPAGLGISGAFGAEMALAPSQWNQELPLGSPERKAADEYMRSNAKYEDMAFGALMGMGAFKGGKYLATQGNNILGGQNTVSPSAQAATLAQRVKGWQPPAAAQPNVVPPTPVPPAPPTGGNLPTDFDSILRGIGESIPRPRGVRGPVGSNAAAPGLSYDPASNGAEMFRQAVAEHLRSGNMLNGFNAADFRRRVVEAAQAAGATEAQVPSVGVFRNALNRLQQLISNEGLTPAQAARRITAANRRGGFENFAVPVMAGGGAAAMAHHSASQPRGDDGRFTTP